MKKRRVLILGCDGLRPDAVTQELMPTCSRLAREGTMFRHFQAAYPSETRVSMTTLTTGVLPGRHGVVANAIYFPGFGETGILQTGNHEHLLEYPRWSGEQFVLAPTLGDRLHAAGRGFAVAGSGSPGASLLWNIRHPEKVINVGATYGLPELEEKHRRLGPAADLADSAERIEWTISAFLELNLPDPRNEALVLWLYQPDKVFHDAEAGSPQACEVLRHVDACVARVLEALQAREGEEFDLLLISDHGHTTCDPQGPLPNHLATACEELGIEVPFAATGKYIYNKGPIADEALERLTGWMKSQPWCGSIYLRHARAEAWGALPVETLLGPLPHGRAPLIIINPTWSSQCNEFGFPGVTQLPAGSRRKSNHGNAVPTDLRAFCVGHGPSFRKETVSEIPCGIVDIAPTVCHLLGMEGESGFDGRILHEGLAGSAALVESRTYVVGEGSQRQPVRIAETNGTRYLVGAVETATV